jgi:hypothetical protein
VNFESKLKIKKEELFYSGNFLRWELSQEDMEVCDKNRLLNDKNIAFNKMLPKDTNYCLALKRNFGFNLISLKAEYKKFRKTLADRFKNHFTNLCSKNSTLLADVFAMVKMLTLNC